MILDEIAAKTKERIARCKEQISFEEMKAKALAIVEKETENGTKPYTVFPFRDNLAKPGISFICEVKKASPSKGLIAPDFPYIEIAKEYEAAGASAISVLTEPFYFQGSNEYLTAIHEAVSTPILRKDFTVDPYMFYEAKVIGASAILLICAILTDRDRTSDFLFIVCFYQNGQAKTCCKLVIAFELFVGKDRTDQKDRRNLYAKP